MTEPRRNPVHSAIKNQSLKAKTDQTHQDIFKFSISSRLKRKILGDDTKGGRKERCISYWPRETGLCRVLDLQKEPIALERELI